MLKRQTLFSWQPTSRIAWRRICCIPYVWIYLTCFVCLTACTILIAVTIEYNIDNVGSATLTTTPAPTTTATTTSPPSNASSSYHLSEYNPKTEPTNLQVKILPCWVKLFPLRAWPHRKCILNEIFQFVDLFLT